jgi:DNA-binding LacI/PurR family transcriptional regulator
MREVAELAGVSTATVSRVLSGSRRSEATTRQRVLSAAEQLAYRPSATARALRRRATQTLGLLVTDIENPFFPEVVRAVEDAAHLRGYGLLLCNAADDPQRELAYLNLLLERRVDGVVIASSRVTRRHAALLARSPVPVVLVNSEARGSGLPAITTDNRRAARLAAEHLLRLGHTNLAHVTAPAVNAAAGLRLAGVRDAMRAARAPSELAIAMGDGHVEAGERAVAELLARVPGLTAIACYNDLTAIGALRAARACGRRVPADLSVVGFDDIDLAGWTDPPLTTVAQPTAEMGRLAVEHLASRLEPGAPSADQRSEVVHLPAVLVERGTTAPPDATRRM